MELAKAVKCVPIRRVVWSSSIKAEWNSADCKTKLERLEFWQDRKPLGIQRGLCTKRETCSFIYSTTQSPIVVALLRFMSQHSLMPDSSYDLTYGGQALFSEVRILYPRVEPLDIVFVV